MVGGCGDGGGGGQFSKFFWCKFCDYVNRHISTAFNGKNADEKKKIENMIEKKIVQMKSNMNISRPDWIWVVRHKPVETILIDWMKRENEGKKKQKKYDVSLFHIKCPSNRWQIIS